jgi:hypothetical protein
MYEYLLRGREHSSRDWRQLFNCRSCESPWSVPESHATFRRSQTRFNSWRGHGAVQIAPRECVGRTAVFEAAGPGPIPGRGTVIRACPRGVTDAHSTLRRSRTGFNSWRGQSTHRRWSQTARPPAATRSKWVRLPPASFCLAPKLEMTITNVFAQGDPLLHEIERV